MNERLGRRHRLAGGSLIRCDTGIVARCECGWFSGGHVTSLAASAAFQDHKESSKDES